ncbi:unnamed protein product [Closterium sp. Yama58-4]|nr:unnamed protein product [Closterium sp. Yama58-4]
MEPSDADPPGAVFQNEPLLCPEISSHTDTELVSLPSDDENKSEADDTDDDNMQDVAIAVSHTRLTQKSGSSGPCRPHGRFRQAVLNFAEPPSLPKKRPRCQQPAPTKEDLEKLDKEIEAVAEKSACKNHDASKVHLQAMEAERLSQGTEVRQRSLMDMLSKYPMMARVIKCMQAAQWCARFDAPIALYPPMVRFMAEQGCPDMVNDEAYGRYYSKYYRYAFGEFIEALAQHLTDRQLQDAKASAWYVLSFDESIDRARGKHLIMYITFERTEEVVTQFFGHLTLDRCNAVSIYEAILAFLHRKDMSLDMLVGVATDGASVMTGSKGGVVALLRKRCPWLVAVHCVAHR